MAPIGSGVSLRGIFFEDSQLPVNLATGINRGTHEGYALTVDTSSANTMKLAGDGDTVLARLTLVENRTVEGINVGTAAFRFSDALPIDTASSYTFAVGDTAVGSPNTSGKVEPKNNGSSKTPDHGENVVVEVDNTNNFVTVVKV
jgi:hypothetical protein